MDRACLGSLDAYSCRTSDHKSYLMSNNGKAAQSGSPSPLRGNDVRYLSHMIHV
jgi:hypothetical protein